MNKMHRYLYSCTHSEEIYAELKPGTVVFCNSCGENVQVIKEFLEA